MQKMIYNNKCNQSNKYESEDFSMFYQATTTSTVFKINQSQLNFLRFLEKTYDCNFPFKKYCKEPRRYVDLTERSESDKKRTVFTSPECYVDFVILNSSQIELFIWLENYGFIEEEIGFGVIEEEIGFTDLA